MLYIFRLLSLISEWFNLIHQIIKPLKEEKKVSPTDHQYVMCFSYCPVLSIRLTSELFVSNNY